MIRHNGRVDIDQVVVAIATYKRPDDLRQLLSSLEAQQGVDQFEVIVIDNDPNGSARTIVDASSLRIVYAVEPKPGIAAARNAALDRLPASATHLIFVDDDEVAPARWISSLFRAASAYGSEIVCGPVRTVFPPDAPRWIERGGYIQRKPEAEGLTSRLPATNNTLLSLACYERAGSPRFDESFSATGGSDSDFFSRLIAASGAKVAWAPDAEVSEEVPGTRLSFRWVMRRYIRINNVSGRLLLRRISPWRLGVKAVLHILYGTLRTGIALITAKGLRLCDTGHITRGLGWLGALSGRHVQEYRRSSS